MKLVIQRIKEAKVDVDKNTVGSIDKGFLVFLGITHTDTKDIADHLVKKLCNLRIFKDEYGKMNLSLKDVGGKLLIVSQFSLYANCKSGNRPSFTNAANFSAFSKYFSSSVPFPSNFIHFPLPYVSTPSNVIPLSFAIVFLYTSNAAKYKLAKFL